MRLKQIKIAGFKSFADPVLIEVNAPFMGIVGPNGCGKSNVIDAIRWVLGEARVSELRGSQTMRELIFAGSTGRHAMGRASVELVLDNDKGMVKGPFGAYSEISVKRQITSDGQNQYFINGQVVRRRDVQEIFLGTGLGPRSYAIISQGMISQVIRAKPEELRGYLEEAAGISVYKERRRETESILKQTQQNVERVRDVEAIKLEELKDLEAQAELARQWETLTQEKNHAEQLWYFLQYDEARETVDRLALDVEKAQHTLDASNATLMTTQHQVQPAKLKLEQAQNQFNVAQAQLREKEKTLMRFEGDRKRRVEAIQTAEFGMKDAKSREAKAQEELEALKAEEALLSESLATLDEQLAMGLAQRELLEEELDLAQGELESAETPLEEMRQRLRQEEQRLASLHAKMGAAKERMQAIRQRLALLVEEPLEEGITESQVRAQEHVAQSLEDESQALTQELESALADHEEAKTKVESTQEAYIAVLSEEKTLTAQLDALDAMEKNDANAQAMQVYEASHELEGLRRLYEDLEIDMQWVLAVESVLRERVQGVFLGFLETVEGFERDRPPSTLEVFDRHATPMALPTDSLVLGGQFFTPLCAAIEVRPGAASTIVVQTLSNYYQTDSLARALKVRRQLPEGVTLITPQGDLVSKYRVRFWAPHDLSQARLSREQLRHRLEEELDRMAEVIQGAQQARESAKEDEAHLKGLTHQLRTQLEVVKKQWLDASREADALRHRWQAQEERRADLLKSRQELDDELELLEGQEETWHDEIDVLEEAREATQRQLSQAEQKAVQMRQKTQSVSQKLQRMNTDMAVLKTTLDNQRRQQQSLGQQVLRRQEDFEAARALWMQHHANFEAAQTVGMDADFDEALKAFQEAEGVQAQYQSDVDEARAQYEQILETQQTVQAQLLPQTEALNQKKTELEVKTLLKTQLSERLTELNADRVALAEEKLTKDPKVGAVRQLVQRLITQITSLGAVNHAALEQANVARSHLAETQKQLDDLEAAMTTMEQAIRKIDEETRDRMRETFELVNGYFGETFTRLFGGGQASLELTDTDMLSAGLEVKAQPPGKRNASIKLLSGGEQALTATALVFGLFKLNPAPFCLLDEVDAPLDEANQARLAQLCEYLSHETQFIMITHHRVTMEYVKSLIGVTMKEPGVSRIVSVAVQEALKLLGAATETP